MMLGEAALDTHTESLLSGPCMPAATPFQGKPACAAASYLS